MRAGQTRLRALFASHQQLRRIDDTLGLNLPRLFGQLGLVQTEMAFIYPVYLHGSGSVYEYSFSSRPIRISLDQDWPMRPSSSELRSLQR